MDVAADLAARRFTGRWRSYQQQALDTVSADRDTGSRRAYLVLPPGAGKTLLGLETARRLGARTLVLVPNTAVLGQWARSWDTRFPGPSPAGTDRSLGTPLTVLTYQSLAVVDEDSTAAERRAAVRAGDREALLELLHDNGRELVRRAAGLGPWTLVLDECHHLLALWGGMVRALVGELGPATSVVGLTATPPALLTGWQRQLRDELFGDRDVEIAAPALVKEGDLAPYRELVYLTAPTPAEDTWLAAQRARFSDLQLQLADDRLGTLPLFGWLRRRAVERGTEAGAALSWPAFEAGEPDLARAALRFAVAGYLPLPDGARVREQHRVPPTAEDWVCVLTDFATGHLLPSTDPRDAEALAAIKGVLPGLGYRLTRRGVVGASSPVDRVCGLSAAKSAAAVHVLETEDGALGTDLRALVLCDFESEVAQLPAALRGAPLDVTSGSARLAFETIAAADVGGVGALAPLLVTGATFAAPAALAGAVVADAAAAGVPLRAEPYPGHPRLRLLVGAAPRACVEVATRFFEAGRARVLVGTRALLGEGWDCAAVNVTLDLTTATTPTAVVQMRGRSLRPDRNRPDKVADNWTITCVTDAHPRGDADYLRLVRKHDAYFAPAADGTIESGVGHCDPALSPYAPPAGPAAAAVTAAALQRVADRAADRALWRIGTPYSGQTRATVRIRAERDPGLAAAALPGVALAPTLPGGRAPRSPFGALTLGGVAVTGGAAQLTAGGTAALLAGGAAVVVAGAATLLPARRWAAAPAGNGSLEDLARAVADALHAIGDTARDSTALRVRPGPDGWLRCELGEVPPAESERFAAALEELLAPLTDPRWLAGRRVITPPATRRGRLALALRGRLGLPVPGAVSWHAVPRRLASSAARRTAFEAAWRRHVAPAPLLAADSPHGRAVLELFRGEDPFSMVTQMRTTWE